MKETVSRIQKGRTTAELQDEVVQHVRRAWAAFDPQRAVALLQTLVTQARKEGATRGLPSSSVHSHSSNRAVAEAAVEGHAQGISVSVVTEKDTGPPPLNTGNLRAISTCTRNPTSSPSNMQQDLAKPKLGNKIGDNAGFEPRLLGTDAVYIDISSRTRYRYATRPHVHADESSEQLEIGGEEDLQSLVTAFIGDKEQAAVAETVAKWRKGYAGCRPLQL
ncbi:hypothetical protein Bbelb_135040 [Branchiostoma belcheri]|nr:hypothetical protein Bbelb_135040 [Branchiostoma belcheri]